MSTYTILGWGAVVVACIALIAFAVSLAYLALGRDKKGAAHLSGEHCWPTFQARSQAWLTAPTNVPALAPHPSAGTSNVTAHSLPRAGAVTNHGRGRAEHAPGPAAPVPAPAVDHRIDYLAEHIAAAWGTVTTPAQRMLLWAPHVQPEYDPREQADTGYSKKDARLLQLALDGDAATVAIRRRFADLEIRDQHRFAAITAGIRTAS